MTSPNRIFHFICALMLALATTGVQANNSVGAAHAANLRSIIESIALHEYLRRQPLPPGPASYEHQFAQLFVRQATEDELVRRATPGLAKVVNPQLAARVARLVGTPAFRAREMRSVTGAQGYASKAEADALRRIDADPAIAEFRKLQPAVRAAIDSTVKAWSRDFAEQLHARAWSMLDKLDEDLRNRPEGSFRQVEVGTVGFEPLDQVVRAIGKSMIRFNKAFARQAQELKATRYDDYFQARYLANTQHLANAYGAIDRAEWILENTVTELNAAIKEREESVARSAISSRPEFRASFDDTVAMLYTFSGDYSEAVRSLTAQHRKLIAFMQTHLFNVTVKDDKLVFSDEEDLRQATLIFDQLRQARGRLDEVIARQSGREAELRRKPAAAGQRG